MAPEIQSVLPYISKKQAALFNVSLSRSFVVRAEKAKDVSLKPNKMLTKRNGTIPTINKLGMSSKVNSVPPPRRTVKIIPAIKIMKESQYLKLNFSRDFLYLIKVVKIKLNKKLKVIPILVMDSTDIPIKTVTVAKINAAPKNITKNIKHRNMAFFMP